MVIFGAGASYLQPSFSRNSFIHLVIYLDNYYTSMVIFHLIVSRHPRRSSLRSPSPLQLCALSLSAFKCSFSFVFFSIQTTNLRTIKCFRPNSCVCHTSEISPVSPIIATDPKSPSRKSFVCHTSETPLGVHVAQPTSPPSRELCAMNPGRALLPFAPFRYFITSLGRYFIFSGDHHD